MVEMLIEKISVCYDLFVVIKVVIGNDGFLIFEVWLDVVVLDVVKLAFLLKEVVVGVGV